jgi:pyrroloquinoline quinone (PQQ) biosynthesis protein C
MLIQLGNALGLTKATMANSEANPATRSVKEWMRKHIIAPDKSDKAQICMALVEGMSPEAGAYLAEGAEEHYGLRADQIQYFTLRMRSKHDAGKDAAQMLSQLPIEQWDFVRDEALIVSRLVDQMYNSVGDMWSSW